MERNFEIIGEAMRRLANEDPETAAEISDHRRIIAFRNILIHGYDLVDTPACNELATPLVAACYQTRARSYPKIRILDDTARQE